MRSQTTCAHLKWTWRTPSSPQQFRFGYQPSLWLSLIGEFMWKQPNRNSMCTGRTQAIFFHYFRNSFLIYGFKVKLLNDYDYHGRCEYLVQWIKIMSQYFFQDNISCCTSLIKSFSKTLSNYVNKKVCYKVYNHDEHATTEFSIERIYLTFFKCLTWFDLNLDSSLSNFKFKKFPSQLRKKHLVLFICFIAQCNLVRVHWYACSDTTAANKKTSIMLFINFCC